MTSFFRRLFTFALGALALGAVALRTVALLFTRAENGFCHPRSFSWLSIFLTVCALAVAALFAISRHSSPAPRMTYLTVSTYLPCALCAAAAVPLAFFLLEDHRVLSEEAEFFGYASVNESFLYLPALRLCGIFLCVLIAYLALQSVLERTFSRLRALLGLGATVFFAAYALFLYFDAAYPLNMPSKLYVQFACFAAAFYIITDVRISLGRALWGWHVLCTYAAMLLCSLASVPELICLICGKPTFTHSLWESLFFFAFSLVAFGRLALLPRLPDDAVSPIAAAAYERAKGD